MSHLQAMSDDQVAAELRKMTAFIRQEAMEKAQEIHVKADEEFEVEKGKLVQAETSRIDTEFGKKFTQAGMSQQITKSTLANKQRLRVLGARQELLDQLFEDADKKLKDSVSKDKKKYADVLKNLILEGLYALNEKKVNVQCRKVDHEVVTKAAKAASEEYKKTMDGRVSEVTVDEKERVPEGSSGGVVIVNGTGRIDIDNTFEERLKLLQIDGLPSVRATLFGENQNRRFKD